jgi:hypothetical protein
MVGAVLVRPPLCLIIDPTSKLKRLCDLPYQKAVLASPDSLVRGLVYIRAERLIVGRGVMWIHSAEVLGCAFRFCDGLEFLELDSQSPRVRKNEVTGQSSLVQQYISAGRTGGQGPMRRHLTVSARTHKMRIARGRGTWKQVDNTLHHGELRPSCHKINILLQNGS